MERTEWNIEDILKTKDEIITNLIDEEWFETYAICGMTYGEINYLENLNHTF